MAKGLTLTPWVLGSNKPSAQRVNINPLHTGLTLTPWVLGLINPVRKGLTLTPWVLGLI